MNLDELRAAIESGNAATIAALQATTADVASMKSQLLDVEKKLNRPGRGGGRDDDETPDQREYKAAFARFVRKGVDSGLADLEMRAMSVQSDPDGGFSLPKDLTGRMVTRVFESSPIRQLADVQQCSSDALEGLRDTDEAAAGWVAEVASRTETTSPQLGAWRIPVHEQYANPRATQKLLDDSAIDVGAWLGGKIADKFARLEATAFVVGSGVGQPRGFTTYPTAATPDATRSWGQFEHVKSGANGDFAASNPADCLFEIVDATKPGYLTGAVWLTRRTVTTKLRKIKDSTGQYLWQPGLIAGAPSTLLGFPVVIAEDMPALATDSLSLAFGNFKIGYQIVDRTGVRLLRDPYSAKPLVQFYATRRVGGDAVQFESIKFVKFAA